MDKYDAVFQAQVSHLPEEHKAIQMGYLRSALMTGKWSAIPKPIAEPPKKNVEAWRARNSAYAEPFPSHMRKQIKQLLDTVSRNCFWEGYNCGRSPQDT